MSPTPAPRRTRVLAVASGGGHFVQLRRMRPAWEHCEVHYLTTLAEYAKELEPGATLHLVNDANRWDKIGVARMALRVLWTLLRLRPKVVISTGAAAGYFALRFGKLLGARTIWIDSIANAEELSLTGRMVGKYADLYLTQWPQLATPQGPRCEGSVL
ncbi:MAG: UDP-N-acetylglucosamine--LPS N-acetylglucosamine transferase [Phycisphaerales bacterium]|nr:UDP-N-acetylglucosamine--LPS N-acetylglucosamine transferase [Phycisphaerales bacterium]